MKHPRRASVAILLALMALVVGGVWTAAAIDGKAPSREWCVQRWNAPGNSTSRSVIAHDGMDLALMKGWSMDWEGAQHSGSKGCLMYVWSYGGGSWVSFFVGDRSLERSPSWGTGDPGFDWRAREFTEATGDGPNAWILPDGSLKLFAR